MDGSQIDISSLTFPYTIPQEGIISVGSGSATNSYFYVNIGDRDGTQIGGITMRTDVSNAPSSSSMYVKKGMQIIGAGGSGGSGYYKKLTF